MQISKKSFILTVILALVFSFSLSLTAATGKGESKDEAESADLESMITEEIQVVGNVPVAKTIQSVSLFKMEELKIFGFTNLKSLLALTPGLLTLSNGSSAQSSSTYIRGSKTTQVLYIVDGVKLRDGAGVSGVNLSVLSPDIIDRVEVVRGPLSSLYGSEAMGGVVNINTFSSEGANVSASYGSHGSYMGNFSGATSLKNFKLGFAVSSQRYSDDTLNDEFKNTGLTAKVNYKKDALELGLRFFGNFTNSGIPYSSIDVPAANRKYKQDYLIFALPFVYNFNDTSRLNVKLAYTNSKYEFEDIDDPWNSYYLGKFDNYEAEIIYSAKISGNLNLDLGVDYSDQKIVNEDNFGFLLDDVKRDYFSAFTNTGWNFDNLQISASVRYDKYKDVTSNVSPQVGVSYLFANRFKLRAAYSHSFMAPLITHQVNPWGRANFSLKPEKGKSIELGAEFYSGKVVLSATYFNTRYQDMIDWVTIDFNTFEGQYQNIANVDTNGIELSATFRPTPVVMLSGSYSYLETEDKATGEPLVRKPKHVFSAFASYAHKWFTLSMNMSYVGKRPDLDFSNWPPDVWSESFNTFDLSLVVPVLESVSLFGKLSNAFDKNYQEIFGYPSPGRRFELGFRYKVK
ncbi:MAG: TonB-dependent receptor [bacterium]|nr:TonB-dependent receptor [bacterium]